LELHSKSTGTPTHYLQIRKTDPESNQKLETQSKSKSKKKSQKKKKKIEVSNSAKGEGDIAHWLRPEYCQREREQQPETAERELIVEVRLEDRVLSE
jgi:Skp family chaperone for outer membrane proteins